MSSSKIIITLALLLCIATYFLGKKNATDAVTLNVINNVQIVKQISELSVLETSGTTSVKLTNTNTETAFWSKVKNYFNENTLLVTVPYTCKYGVEIGKQNITLNTKDKTVNIELPKTKMLSLQLRLDALETMNKTGLFATTTIADLTKAEKNMYEQAVASMSADTKYLNQCEQYITEALNKYYEPLGYKAICTFANK